MAAPSSGAATSSTNARLTGAGQPQSNRTCQYRNAISIPTAPWAMLNTPDVV